MANEIKIVLNKKQRVAFRYMMDKYTNNIIYGGGAGSGKSWVVALYLWLMMNKYHNLKYAVCRSCKSNAASNFTTTFMKLVSFYGEDPRKYKHCSAYIINTETKSQIIFLNIAYLPSDPNFDRFGSMELTGSIIEECQECSREAVQYISTRIGRQLNKEYGIKDVLILTCNPGPGYLYTDHYMKRDMLSYNIDHKFISATVTDNIDFIPDDYVSRLASQPEEIRRRQYLGEWNFADCRDDIAIPYSLITSACLNEPKPGEYRLGIDVAGHKTNSDKTIITPLNGNIIEKPIIIDTKSYSGPEFDYDEWLSDEIIHYIIQYNITKMNNVRIDACGELGSSLYKCLKRKGYPVFPFQGHVPQIKRQNEMIRYNNLRTQSYFEFKKKLQKHEIYLPPDYDESLVQDISAVRYSEYHEKLALEDKKLTKGRLGRSPDLGDSIIMACLEITNSSTNNSSSSFILSNDLLF